MFCLKPIAWKLANKCNLGCWKWALWYITTNWFCKIISWDYAGGKKPVKFHTSHLFRGPLQNLPKSEVTFWLGCIEIFIVNIFYISDGYKNIKKCTVVKPCNEPENIVKERHSFGLPDSCGAIIESPKWSLRAFILLSTNLRVQSSHFYSLGWDYK